MVKHKDISIYIGTMRWEKARLKSRKIERMMNVNEHFPCFFFGAVFYYDIWYLHFTTYIWYLHLLHIFGTFILQHLFGTFILQHIFGTFILLHIFGTFILQHIFGITYISSFKDTFINQVL